MPKQVGPYGKLLANYADDDAIIAAGEKAELLFCRAIAFLSTSDSDGYVTDRQLERRVGSGMRDVRARAQALVREGLWLRVEGGYQVRSYLKINDSAEEKGRKLASDRERKRRERRTESDPESDPESEACPSGQEDGQESDSERNPNGVTPDSFTGLNVTNALRNQSSPVNGKPPDNASESDRFDEFWDAYPKHVAKQAARRRWDIIVKNGTDPGDIIAGAKSYADQVRGAERQFVKQPDGWLLAGRWQDEPPPAVQPTGWWDN
jgi:hypothetical protein